jgi:diadenosine tetraphosphatase ApaH/serine/threonine PP2A family protein phosphatase
MNELARRCAEWTQSALGTSELGWLAALPVEHVSSEWMAVHGAPRDPRRFFAYVYELTYEDNLRDLRERRMRVCFHGHSHVQMAHAELAAGPTKIPGPCRYQLDPRYRFLVNPGSVGQPRDGDARAAFALWNRRTGELAAMRAPYDVERTVRAIRARGLPEQLERRLSTGT